MHALKKHMFHNRYRSLSVSYYLVDGSEGSTHHLIRSDIQPPTNENLHKRSGFSHMSQPVNFKKDLTLSNTYISCYVLSSRVTNANCRK